MAKGVKHSLFYMPKKTDTGKAKVNESNTLKRVNKIELIKSSVQYARARGQND